MRKEKIFSADAAKWLVEEAEKRGIPSSAVLSGTGLNNNWLKAADTVLSAGQYRKLVLNALDQTRDPTIGLCAASQFNYISRFGFWGYAIISSTNWKKANRIALRYWDVSGSLVRLKFYEEGDTCVWEIYPGMELNHEKILIFAVEKVISSAFATIEFATGSPPPVREIQVSYAPPDHAALYRDYWKAPVRFRQERNLVRMDASIQERPILMANPRIMEVCQQQCRQLLSNLKNTDEFIELIRRVILGTPGAFPNADQVAGRLGMSPRTLRRRLQQRGVHYMKLIDELRAELAMGYLTSTTLSIDEIADLLGYAETTTFRRSFKKWLGRSASDVRKSIRFNPL